MMSPGESQHLVYAAPGGTQPAVAPQVAEAPPRTCCGVPLPKSAAVSIRVLGILLTLTLMVVQFIGVFTNLATFDIHEFLLSTYVVVFATCCLFAELRFIDLCRRCTYGCLKYVYFVSSALGRGLFYIFMGSLLLTDVVGWILGLAVIAIGVANVVMAVCCKDQIPVYYDDPENPQAQPQVYVAQPVGGAPAAPGQPQQNPFAASGSGIGAAAQFAYENRQHLTAENAQAAAQFYQDNKQHMTKENFDKAQQAAQVFSYK